MTSKKPLKSPKIISENLSLDRRIKDILDDLESKPEDDPKKILMEEMVRMLLKKA